MKACDRFDRGDSCRFHFGCLSAPLSIGCTQNILEVNMFTSERFWGLKVGLPLGIPYTKYFDVRPARISSQYQGTDVKNSCQYYGRGQSEIRRWLRMAVSRSFLKACDRESCRSSSSNSHTAVPTHESVWDTKAWSELDGFTRHHWTVLGWNQDNWEGGYPKVEIFKGDSRHSRELRILFALFVPY